MNMSAPSSLMKQPPIQSTAGAVPVSNEQGEISMEKVKRYVSGKRPDFAPMESSDEEDEEFQFIKKDKASEAEPEEQEEDSLRDPRLRRLQNRISEDVELGPDLKLAVTMGFTGFGKKARTFDLEAMFEQTRRTAMERSRKTLEAREKEEEMNREKELRRQNEDIEPTSSGSDVVRDCSKSSSSDTSSSGSEESSDSSDDELIGPPLPPTMAEEPGSARSPAAAMNMSAPSALMKQPPIQSTAGAVPVRNEKGEILMEKVKVKCYVSGKRPDYAPMESSDEEDEEFQFIKKAKEQEAEPEEQEEDSSSDPRLRRLQNRISEDVEERLARHRKIVEPGVVGESDSEVEGDVWRMEREDSSEEEEQEIDDEEIEWRRGMMRQRAQERQNEEMEVMEVEDEGRSGEESESESEYEEYTDSEDEMEPRLKPVFIRKKDRVTVQEREAEALKQKELEQEAKRRAEERRKYTLKIVEEETKKELEENKRSLAALDALNTDDENDEEEYEAWKVRELKRIKRDREDREAMTLSLGGISREWAQERHDSTTA
ncbi:Microfibrillar-associated protein 1 [Myotis brandtii]|uniref:Microfibrillar-associated protein 1 n=2 Tax=Myotis brandtii TaxID=109478 RepID=S7PTK9_MYOBR|nr:Microfibrillar-associated protein 1 [Myotis brandtii]